MKNRFVYYLFIGIPLVGLIFMVKNQAISPTVFFWGLMFYAFIYHPTISAIRLYEKGDISKSEIWNIYVPFFGEMKYFKQLFLE